MERRSAQTASTYKLVVETFLHWCVENRIKLSAVTIQNLIYFLAWRRTNNCSPLTIAKDISALRAFGSYLVRQKIWKENLVFMLDRPKASRSLPKVLSADHNKLFVQMKIVYKQSARLAYAKPAGINHFKKSCVAFSDGSRRIYHAQKRFHLLYGKHFWKRTRCFWAVKHKHKIFFPNLLSYQI